MVSSAHYLAVSLPQSANCTLFLQQFSQTGKLPLSKFPLPDFQIKTLDSLVQLSEELSKLDGTLSSSVAKVVEIVEAVEPNKSFNETRVVNGRPATYYAENFLWNTSKFRLDKPMKELVDLITLEALALDNDVRSAYQLYQTAKSNFMAADRKKNGDLSIKSLHEIVRPEHFVLDSEHLTTLLVAVPKQLESDFKLSYEQLTEFVVPRSAQLVATDSEFALHAVTLFKKYQEDFVHAAREHKWHPRTDFTYSEDSLNEMRKEFDHTRAAEVKSKNDLIRLAKTAYSEIFAAWFHIKAVRVYVESVLRYGLPPQFDSFVIRFVAGGIDPAKAKKELVAKYGYLGGESTSEKGNLHEYASLVDSDYEPFVLYPIEIV